MKKVILILIVFFLGSGLIFFFKPMLFNYLTQTARVLKKDHNYELKINDTIFKNRTYKITRSFDKKSNRNALILNLRDLKINTEFEIIYIDLDSKIIGYTCNSLDCYDEIFNDFFQNEVGSFYVAFENSAKGPGFNTNLKIENGIIDFYIPSERSGKIHIQLSKNK